MTYFNPELERKSNQIIDTILSCTDEEQLKAANRMIDSFIEYCDKTNVNPTAAKEYISSLRGLYNNIYNKIVK